MLATDVSGDGPPLVLLHGFPETRTMWRDVVPMLATEFTVVTMDLTGYGDSPCPPSDHTHARYTKRAMAADVIQTMETLGYEQFAVAGHDRGGRVAYRMALDHPARVRKLAVLDIIPAAAAWERFDAELALSFWPWSLLAQPAPLPERLLTACPEAIVDDAFTHWGSPADAFPEQVRDRYVAQFRDPGHAHAICEEYRAAATLDCEHDATSRAIGQRITCPTLVLWSAEGGLATWYADEGGPLAIWRQWSDDVRGHPVDGGHFFPEVQPTRTAHDLLEFFR
ncbi:alpha/beta fold hydrolase [Nonomuraea sp. NPDC048826]|uniref:alpha/beta fold hydrolase n=1 Tax=Nonomuraea sp. NPDC048826 TaxID=3364347 RepID=UPI00371D14DE